MKTLYVDTVKGIQEEKLYEINELSYLGKLLGCKDSKKRGITYLEIPCAFDIETTNIYKKDEAGNIDTEALRPYAFMYHWQFCLDDQVCFGRTWEDFQRLISNLSERMNLSYNHRLVIYVHNLSFEFQFMRRFLNVVEGFYKEPYKPLKVLIDEGIEFRDSYVLSNMNLRKFCENERDVIHYKLSGEDFDYSKIRTPDTELSEKEKAYCYNDVRGLCECIRSRMQDHTLASMPMTSTGYVRIECRNNMRKNKRNRKRFLDMKLDADLYTMCREAFRGGDTHANLRWVNQVIHNVESFDITSSYPAAMMLRRYPGTAFFKITLDSFLNRDLSDFALLFRVRLQDVKYKGTCGIPYIPRSKCTAITSDAVIDNGRVIFAGMIEMTLTDIDWEIIKEEYSFSASWFKDIYASHYEEMPKEFKDTLMSYYKGKTELKGIPDKEYEYMKSKNKLNGLYGMQVMRIDHEIVQYSGTDYVTDRLPLPELLEAYYKNRNSFLSYQQGVWVTAWARKQLRDMLRIIGPDVVYCDTDSIKYVGDHDKEFEEMNNKIIQEAESAGAYADDIKGKRRYLGVWDYEGCYDEFKTLGAKKYIYMKDHEYHSVIAGVNRKAGHDFFNKNGVDAFRIGTVINDSGHLTAFYNDDEIHTLDINGGRFTSASNVALVDNTYTIGVTNEYMDLLEKALDKREALEYI